MNNSYTYDRTASTRPEVAIRYEGGWGYISALIEDGLSVWKKQFDSEVEALQELELLKGQIERLSGDNAFDKAFDLVDAAKFRSGRLEDRDKELSRKQYALHQVRDKKEARELRKWLRGWIVSFVEDVYESYRSRGDKKEPCVTAGYVRGMILQGGAAPSDMRQTFKKLTTRQQLAACHYALESAKKAGKLQTAIGLGWGGGEARCYEPT